MYHLYRPDPTHKWKVSATPPSTSVGDDLLHPMTSPTRAAAIVRRVQLNAAIERERAAAKKKKAKPRGAPGHPNSGRKKTGNKKVRVVLTVPPEIAALIPGNRNEYGNAAVREKLERDGFVDDPFSDY
jgi:hypothetical protein